MFPYSLALLQHKQQVLGDKMDLSSYLLKPVQRISKYSLLLQDMLRECDGGPRTGRERMEIQTALEIVQFQLRHGNNLLAMDDIQDCDVSDGDIRKRLIQFKQKWKIVGQNVGT